MPPEAGLQREGCLRSPGKGPRPAATLRISLRGAKIPCGATQKFLARQIPLRSSVEKFGAPNSAAEL